MKPSGLQRRAIHGVALTAAVLLGAVLPTRVDGQIASSPNQERRLVIAPYAWLAGISGETGVRDLSTDVDVSFLDLFDYLRFAGMGSIEGGYGDWLAGLDLMYTSVRVDELRSLAGTQLELVMTQKMLIASLYGGYSFDSEKIAIDVLAGARVWSVDTGLNVAGAEASAERQHDGGWVDALIGARARWWPAERWQVSLGLDGGGGGSQNTADALITAGYDISTRWSLFLAYRYLHVDRVKDDFFFDGHLMGPALGAVYRW